MLRNKTYLYISFLFFIGSMMLNFPFPNKKPLGYTLFSALHLRLQYNGLQFVGIFSLCLLFIACILLVHSLQVYHGRLLMLALAITAILPSIAVNVYQDTIANGIYAVKYQSDKAACHFEMGRKSTLNGKCMLPFENVSGKKVHFYITFYDTDLFKDHMTLQQLMKNSTPYKVELKAHSRNTVVLKTKIDVSSMKRHMTGGDFNGVNVMIRSGSYERRL